MTLQVKLVVLLLTLLLGFGTGFGVRAYVASKDKLRTENKELTAAKADLTNYIADVAARDIRIQQLQDTLADLDTTSTKALDEKLAENSRLAADLGTAQRMRLQGASCAKPTPVGDALSSGSLGNDAAVVLSGETRQAVFDLRSALEHDRAKIVYLQDHIEELRGYLQGLTTPQ